MAQILATSASDGVSVAQQITVVNGATLTSTKNIIDTAITDVSDYANAQVVDSNLTASNIKEGVTILGVTGTCPVTAQTNPLVINTSSVTPTADMMGKFIKDSVTGEIYTVEKTNELYWHQSYLPGSYRGVAYGNGKFVAVGYNITPCNSADGIHWTKEGNLPTSNFYSIIFGNDRFITVSSSSGVGAYYSLDGVDWVAMTGLPSGFYAYSEENSALCYGNGRYILHGYNGSDWTSYYSTDGETWTEATTGVTNAIYSTVYGNSIYLAVSSDWQYSSPVWASRDGGLNWNNVGTAAGYGYYCGGLQYIDGKFLINRWYTKTSPYYYHIYNSLDGSTWVSDGLSDNLVGQWVLASTNAEGRFISTGGYGKSFCTSDGKNIIELKGLNTDNTYCAVTYGNGRAVCISSSSYGYAAYLDLNEIYEYKRWAMA